MKTGAMICGIIGGLFGLIIGMFGAGIGAMASAAGSSGAGIFQLISIGIPVASIVGGAIAKASAIAAGILMAASAAGMGYVFGVNAFTGIPLALTGVGALLAFTSTSER
jgi:hypothetical protein